MKIQAPGHRIIKLATRHTETPGTGGQQKNKDCSIEDREEKIMPAEIDPTQAVRILVVEDDLHIGRLIGLAMPALKVPYHFTNVMSAVEALELWKKEAFDLLLTDYNLPGMNGIQLIETLKREGITIPVVLFTAYDSPDVESKARKAGVAAYMAKPFAIDQMIDIIRGLLPARARAVNSE